jgi:hypothetical protein
MVVVPTLTLIATIAGSWIMLDRPVFYIPTILTTKVRLIFPTFRRIGLIYLPKWVFITILTLRRFVASNRLEWFARELFVQSRYFPDMGMELKRLTERLDPSANIVGMSFPVCIASCPVVFPLEPRTCPE